MGDDALDFVGQLLLSSIKDEIDAGIAGLERKDRRKRMIADRFSGKVNIPPSDTPRAVVLSEVMVDSELRHSEVNVVSFSDSESMVASPKNYKLYVQIADRSANDSMDGRVQPDFHDNMDSAPQKQIKIRRKRMYLRVVAQGASSQPVVVKYGISYKIVPRRLKEGWLHVVDTDNHMIRKLTLSPGKERLLRI